MKLVVFRQIFKIYSLPIGDYFFHADRLMHMTKLMIIFRNFAKESKSIKQIICSNTKHNFEFSKCTVAANVFQNIFKTTKRNSL